MRTVTYGGACSLDGFITAADGSIDWLYFSPDVGEIMATYWKGVDTMLMGRKTWDVAQAQGGGGAGPASVRTVVFSRTLDRIDVPGVQLVKDDPGAFVRALKATMGGNICVMGGGDLARSLFEADVIDEVGFNVHPVLLGSGTPAFLNPKHRIALELTECRQLRGGCVYVTYRVKHRRAVRSKTRASEM